MPSGVGKKGDFQPCLRLICNSFPLHFFVGKSMYGVSVWVCSWVPSKVCVGVVWRKAEKKENLKRWQVSDIKIIESIIPGDVGP